LAIIKKYLDVAGAKKVSALHTTPLPSDFIPTVDGCSENEEISQSFFDLFGDDVD